MLGVEASFRLSDTAFTGVGGLHAASRWNHLGVAMVYTLQLHALLAALESSSILNQTRRRTTC